MKAICSPFNDDGFNEYLCSYVKDRLKKRSLIFECKYKLDVKELDNDNNEIIKEIEFTPDDVIKSIRRSGRLIYFSNRNLINHVVYDLSQRFWYEELKTINNMIYRLNMEYRSRNG